ncbi:peptidoglycan DD-metalloendopeptidase family protein [Subdoligranulum sp. DSM 109015]|uniref:Peptidoglycan DD-metalloendopeptidase family protein n=1 Tax=Gemmiger gallinarum TaxID=2779354 RepID=A0ABR9QZK6_9FIRM|nr:M23 family metallopeptidase [Gemmiger gallinarum]MBE5036321.1 peptidoglycan DD-metalloendopeptidase family protein [Gemmiger gallinarum]
MTKKHLEQNHTEEPSPRRGKKRGKFAEWLDVHRIKRTVRLWHKRQKKSERRSRLSEMIHRLPHATLIGDLLYMFGFWLEYAAICAGRTVLRVAGTILSHVWDVLLMIIRPLAIGIITFLEDLLEPLARMRSGLRHIRALPQQHPEENAKQIRAEKIQYFKRGTRLYLPLVWNALSYALPVAAAVLLVWVVRTQLSFNYLLEVRVNGESVGYVASEQVFDSARDDVQSRIERARAVMESAGVETTDDAWNISPTYTLAVSGDVMTESEVADAILSASSDEIGDGTAVYIDGELRFVTSEGDHLRAYLDAVKQPYEDAFDSDRRVEFAHDITLVDGVYFLSSIVPYDTVIETLNAKSEPVTYTVTEDQTAGEAAKAIGVDYATLQSWNPDLTGEDEELTEGQTLVSSEATAELLQVKVVERQSVLEDVQYDVVKTESDEYDFGKEVVVQEGQLGLQEVTSDVTYINGKVSAIDIVNITTVIEPVSEQVIVGTKLQSDMVAQVGSGNFYWPVPDYKGVTRWVENDRYATDITANYGTPIIAADSGVVVTAGTHWSYGNYVVIDHGNGWKTLYAHMSSIAVTTGQSVTGGQTIGYVGQTGVATGCHCHFEMSYNGTLVNAHDYFPNM